MSVSLHIMAWCCLVAVPVFFPGDLVVSIAFVAVVTAVIGVGIRASFLIAQCFPGQET